MIVNNTNPDPINKSKAIAYYKSLYESNGLPFDEGDVSYYAGLEDQKGAIKTWHYDNLLANKIPQDQEIDSIYNSWIDEKQVEKKNRNETFLQDFSDQPNVVGSSEQQSTSADTQSSSDLNTITQDRKDQLDQHLVSVEDNHVYYPPPTDPGKPIDISELKEILPILDEENYLSKVVDDIPIDIFRMNEGDAEMELDLLLGPFGYEVSESGSGKDMLTITTPTGATREFRLFTQNGINLGYKDRLKFIQSDEKVDQRESQAFQEFKDFLSTDVRLIDQAASRFRQTDIPLQDNIAFFRQAMVRPSATEIQFVAQLSGMPSMTFSNDQGVFDVGQFERAIVNLFKSFPYAPTDIDVPDATDIAMSGVVSAYQSDASERIEAKVEEYINQIPQDEVDANIVGTLLTNIYKKLQENKANSSTAIGAALKLAGITDSIDLFDKDKIDTIYNSGVDLADFPTQGIKINGKASSLNNLQDIILTPQGRNSVIRGEVLVDVDKNHEAYGELSPYVKGAHSILERQEAYMSQNPNAKIASEAIENFGQALGIGMLDILSSFGYALQDLFRSQGMSDRQSSEIVYGTYGMPITKGFIPKTVIDSMREEYLPLYDKGISEADSFAEALALVNQPFAESIPYFALFAANPTLGLTTTGVSTYGTSLYELDKIRDAAKVNIEDGMPLTESQKKALEMSNWEARGYALAQGGTEVLLTRLFTYNYFKKMSAVKSFAGIKNLDNARKIAREYTKQTSGGYRKQIANMLGIEYKALKNEIPEETLIALANYTINTWWGLEDWDDEKARKLFLDTGLTSVFTAQGMSKFAKFGQSKRLKQAVDGVLKTNIVIPGETAVNTEFLFLDSEVQRLTDEGKDEANYEFKTAVTLKNKAQQKVLLFEKRKQDLVDKMTQAHKQTFLEKMVLIEEATNVINDPTSNNAVKKGAIQNIEKYQAEMSELLSGYPSELGYYFLTKDKKLIYDEKAKKSLIEEAEQAEGALEEGSGVEFKLDQEDISQRASELYYDDVINKRQENLETFLPAPSYTILDPTKYFVNLDPKEIEDFNLNNTITTIREARSQKKLFDQTKIDKTDNSEDGDTKLQDAAEFVDIPKRLSSVLDRLSNFNRDDDFFSFIPDGQRNKVIKYLNGVKSKGKDPLEGIGDIEAILDSYDLAVEMAAKNPDKIKIFDIQGFSIDTDLSTNDSYLSQVYKKINAISQKYVTAKWGFGTGDIIAKTLFRDANKGSEFIKLYQEIGRKIQEEEQSVSSLYDTSLNEYKNAVIAHNKKNNSLHSTNANDLDNSYELYMLAGAFRQSGVKDNNGLDMEFNRWRSLLKQELDLRKQDYDNFLQGRGTDPFNLGLDIKARYDKWKEVYERLDIENANNFDDIAAKALGFNVDFIRKLATLQKGDQALERITDFGGKIANDERGTDKPFVDGTYIPVPFYMNTESSSTTKTTEGQTNESDTDAAILNEITFAETLGDLRLNPGLFARNAFMRMKGANIDISARKDVSTFRYLLESPQFKGMFESEADFNIIKTYFDGKIDQFNQIVTEGSSVFVDIGSPKLKKILLDDGSRALYSTLSATALARPDQRPSQFFSAVSGTYPYIQSDRARNHLNKLSALYLAGLSGSANGAVSKNRLSRFIQNSLLGRGDLSNIYAKSRTGARNALKADFVLDDNTKMPVGYYLDFFGVEAGKLREFKDVNGNVVNFKSTKSAKYTLSEFFNFLTNGSELSLEIFLASSDKAAANAAFEAHYIDARVAQGENLSDVNMKEWWKKENANPNIDAINKADGLVAQTMRQTGRFSEAALYSREDETTKFFLRAALPFQKFVTNARANFGLQYAILKDPTVPESQKEQARNAMRGIVQEILTFKGIKQAAAVTAMQGLSGLLGYFSDEEDIDRYGGYAQLIGSDIAPIEDRPGVIDDIFNLDKEYSDLMSDKPVTQKATKEGEAIAARYGGTPETIEKAGAFLDKFSREYENKFKIGNKYSILMPAVQDIVSTVFPGVVPDFADDMFFAKLNDLLDKEVFQEFVSGDLKNAKTKEGRRNFIINQLGIFTIAEEKYNKIMEAFDLYGDNMYTVYSGEYGEQTRYVSAGSSVERQERLQNAIKVNLLLRLTTELAPGMPKGELTKIGNYLQRAIENEFDAGTKPDPNMETKPDMNLIEKTGDVLNLNPRQ